jgi:isopentenyl-diphosphate Delta-isomerase
MSLACRLSFVFSFTYKAKFTNGLIEHEFDHVYFGTTDDMPVPNPSEVKAWKYMDMELLNQDLQDNPGHYTEWLAICFPEVKNHYDRLHNRESKQ